jgi:hypothetical protein
MSPVFRAAAILTALASLLLAGEASAQTEAERAAARELATSAQEALDRQDYAAAADRFERAAAIVHAPTVQLGLARAQVGLGQWRKALETYRRIVKTPVTAGAPGVFHQAARDAKGPRMDESRDLVGHRRHGARFATREEIARTPGIRQDRQ